MKKKYLQEGKRIALVTALLIGICTLCGCKKTDTSFIPTEDINNMYANPEEYEGRAVELTGRVFNSETYDDTLFIQMHHDVEHHKQSTVVIINDQGVKDFDLRDGECIYINGHVDGIFEGENALGEDISCPQITATYIETINITDAIPAEKSVDLNKTITKGEVKATVTKVDWTKDYMRIYLEMENFGSKDFSNYPGHGDVIQDGRQYDSDTFNIYPSPSLNIKPGVTTEYVVVFKGVEQSDFTYIFSGYDDDFHVSKFKFNIKVEE